VELKGYGKRKRLLGEEEKVARGKGAGDKREER